MKYSIIRKLDDADSEKVQHIVSRIYPICAAVGWELVEEADSEVIIAIGGDGTMLYAMMLSHQLEIPVIGFNIGKIGFLAEFQPDEIEKAIIGIVSGEYYLDNRTILCSKQSGIKAVNEFAITPVLAKDTIKYEFFIDGRSSGQHHANGLVISTPTGSTAYSLSIGGAILQPNTPVVQIAPIAPMSLSSRSVVVSDSSTIRVKLHLRKNVNYNLIADGRVAKEFNGYLPETDREPASFTNTTSFEFYKCDKPAILMHSNKWNFFDVLHKKLGWNAII